MPQTKCSDLTQVITIVLQINWMAKTYEYTCTCHTHPHALIILHATNKIHTLLLEILTVQMKNSHY